MQHQQAAHLGLVSPVGLPLSTLARGTTRARVEPSMWRVGLKFLLRTWPRGTCLLSAAAAGERAGPGQPT